MSYTSLVSLHKEVVIVLVFPIYFPDMNVYESTSSKDEYLVFHYASQTEIFKWNFELSDGFNFPKKCVDICIKFSEKRVSSLVKIKD